MIFSRPKTPDGRNPESIFQQRMIDAPQALQSITVQGQRTSRTTRGTYSIPDAPPATGASGAIKGPYRLTAMQGDYLICRKDDSVPEGPFVYIAFADDADGTGYTQDFTPKADASKYFIGVKTSATKIDPVDAGTFSELWAAWSPVYIAKEEQHRQGIDSNGKYDFEAGPDNALTQLRIVKQHSDDPEATPVLVEIQTIAPEWELNEAIYAVSAKTEIGTLETDDVPSQTVKLMIFGRMALWSRYWGT